MTKAQRTLYWREFSAVKRVYPEADRHDLHVQALGQDKSSNDLGNADLDKVLAVFRAISRPSDLDGQVQQVEQPLRRSRWAMEQVMLCLALYVDHPDAYRDAIIRDRWPTHTVRTLSADQLRHVRMTIWDRLNAADTGFRNQAGHSLHEMCIRAGARCSCAACSKARAPRPSTTQTVAA